MKLRNVVPDKNKTQFCNLLLDKIEEFGLGSFSKVDIDSLIYYLIDINKDGNFIHDNYDWISLLKVTPTTLRNLQLVSSVKSSNLEYTEENWYMLANALTNKRIEIEDAKKGMVRFYVDNTHIQRFIEKFVVDSGSSQDYQRNPNQIVLKYGTYLELLNRLRSELDINVDEFGAGIQEDESYKKIEEVFNSPHKIFNDFKEKFKDKAFDEIATTAINLISNTIIKYVKKKIS